MGADKSASAGELYTAYTEWAAANGLRALSHVRFSTALAERGLTKARMPGDGRQIYQGIGILAIP